MENERDFTLEELRILKTAVIRAIDTLHPNETEFGVVLDGMYQKLRNLGA
jgi:predicted butyrate kinase (DUF1464 family)